MTRVEELKELLNKGQKLANDLQRQLENISINNIKLQGAIEELERPQIGAAPEKK